jgi:hypothetical protein
MSAESRSELLIGRTGWVTMRAIDCTMAAAPGDQRWRQTGAAF